MEKISVIVPIYKVEKYLDKCVESIVVQSYADLEIILVDDGSPDQCPALCDEWAQKDSRIRVIHKANGGLSDARNAGVDIASGAYISFVDSDDYLSADFMEKLHRALKETDADISAANYRKVDENGSVLPKEQWETLDSKVLSGQEVLYDRFSMQNSGTALVIACAKLFKREIFETYRFAQNRLNEDEFAFFPIYMAAKKVACIADELYFYLQRSDSIMGQKISQKRIEDNYAYWQERLALSKGDPILHKKVAVAYCVWIFLTALPNIEKENAICEDIVKEYRWIIRSCIFDKEIDLPFLHKVIYYAAVLNPYAAAKIKHKLAG